MPEKPDFRRHSVELSYEQVSRVLDRCSIEVIQPIEEQLSDIAKVQEEAGEQPQLPQIVFSGGGSQIPYLQQKMNAHFPQRYHLSFPSESNRSLVAEGAVLATQRPGIGDRYYPREAYGVPETVGYDPRIHKKSDAKAAEAYHGYATGKDVLFCFVPVTLNDRLATATKHQGIMEIKAANKEWPVKIRIDILKCVKDELADQQYWKAGCDIEHLYTNKVKYSYEICVDIERHQLRVVKSVKGLYSIKYRVVPMWNGLAMVFFVVLHSSGDFPIGYDDFRYVKDCLVKRLVEGHEVARRRLSCPGCWRR